VFCKDVKKWLIKHQSQVPEGNALRRLNVLSIMISALIRPGRASLQIVLLGDGEFDGCDLQQTCLNYN